MKCQRNFQYDILSVQKELSCKRSSKVGSMKNGQLSKFNLLHVHAYLLAILKRYKIFVPKKNDVLVRAYDKISRNGCHFLTSSC